MTKLVKSFGLLTVYYDVINNSYVTWLVRTNKNCGLALDTYIYTNIYTDDGSTEAPFFPSLTNIQIQRQPSNPLLSNPTYRVGWGRVANSLLNTLQNVKSILVQERQMTAEAWRSPGMEKKTRNTWLVAQKGHRLERVQWQERQWDVYTRRVWKHIFFKRS